MTLKIIYFERERKRVGGGVEGEDGKTERISCRLPLNMEPYAGLDIITLISWPQLKSKFRCLTNWPSQVPLEFDFNKRLESDNIVGIEEGDTDMVSRMTGLILSWKLFLKGNTSQWELCSNIWTTRSLTFTWVTWNKSIYQLPLA